MRKFFSLFIAGILAATTLAAITSNQASAAPTLTTCINLETGKSLVLQSADGKCRSHLGSVLWVQEQSDSRPYSGAFSASMTVCSSKNSLFTYKLIRGSCAQFQVSTNYWRTVAAPATPIIESVGERGHDSAALLIKPATSAISAAIAYYLVTDIKSGQIRKVSAGHPGHLRITGLDPLTAYTFQIAAVNIDGTSALSLVTPEIKTTAVPIAPPAPVATPALAAPAFTISSATETKPVNSAITGYIITSTGGAIASYSISPAAPAGLTLSTSTGLLSGTPTSVVAATAYTITATNATGSTTRIFTLTVTAIVYVVGDTGPGGGKVFYYNATGFNCGATHSATGSPTGGLCHHLEVAPKGWHSGVATDPQSAWVNLVDNRRDVTGVINENEVNNSFTGLGLGYKNSLAIIEAIPSEPSAASLTRAYLSNSLSDWYLPTAAELNELYKWANSNITQPALGTVGVEGILNSQVNGFTSNFNFVNHYYWSSSEQTLFFAWHQWFVNGAQLTNTHFKSAAHFVRPIRAF